MSTPLAVLVGGGHTRYLLTAADLAQGYIHSPKYRASSHALRLFGYTPDQLMAWAVVNSTEIRTDEEIREVCKILTERGVVP